MDHPILARMLLLLTTSLCLLLHALPVSASNNKLPDLPLLPKATHEQLLKRWYGVKPLHPPIIVGGWGPWPIMCPNAPAQTQPIRYCFKDARSATTLQPIVDQAVARWAHALHPASSLQIGLDDETAKVCSDPKVRPDALVISDESRPDDPKWDWDSCHSQSTVGYNYGSDAKGRHTLEFCHLKPGDEVETGPTAVQAMMHELGHVMGLQHEHQRPDRGKVLTFVCKNLDDYEQAVKNADFDAHAHFPDDMDLADKILFM